MTSLLESTRLVARPSTRNKEMIGLIHSLKFQAISSILETLPYVTVSGIVDGQNSNAIRWKVCVRYSKTQLIAWLTAIIYGSIPKVEKTNFYVADLKEEINREALDSKMTVITEDIEEALRNSPTLEKLRHLFDLHIIDIEDIL